jgi:hypothetical protein
MSIPVVLMLQTTQKNKNSPKHALNIRNQVKTSQQLKPAVNPSSNNIFLPLPITNKKTNLVKMTELSSYNGLTVRTRTCTIEALCKQLFNN